MMTWSRPSGRLGAMQGVSLLEVLVTLAIIGILALIAVPSYNGMIEGQRLRGAAEALAADLRWARSEALKRGLPVRVACTSGSNWSCSVVADASGNGSFDDDDAFEGALVGAVDDFGLRFGSPTSSSTSSTAASTSSRATASRLVSAVPPVGMPCA